MRGLSWEVLLETGELMVSFLLFLVFVAYVITDAYLCLIARKKI